MLALKWTHVVDPPSNGAPVQGRPKDPGQPCILVVDDEPDILASYAELIESMTGARALQATSGRAAIPLMQSNAVDLVVSDFNMPGMDGITFLSLCKDRWPGARRILVTAFETDTLQQRARHEARIHGFLSKSGDPDSFLDGLQAALAG